MEKANKQRISKFIFFASVFFILLMIFFMYVFPNQTKAEVNKLFNFLCYDLGWMFLLIVFAAFAFSIYLACSRYGGIKLGKPDEPKQYSEFAWAAMMFTAGLGIAVTVLSFIEPLMFLQDPVFGIEPLSEQAFEYALVPDQFLYGFSAWAIYTPFVVAVAVSLYIKREETLRLSTACAPVLGKYTNGNCAKIIDVIANIGTVGGISSSLGLGIPIVTKFLHKLTGLEEGIGLTIAILVVWTCIFGTSVFLGLDKGIKNLSTINLYLLGAIAIVFLTVNPINDAINMWVNSLGLMLDNFGKLSFGTDPIVKSGFAQGWVIFYWAWYLTFAPMMGLFVARISKGRTVREVVAGLLVWGALACMICFGLFGSYAIKLQYEGTVDLVGIYKQFGREEAVFAIFETLPFKKIVETVYVVLVFVFLSTTIDSTAYVLSSTCTDNLSGNEQPKRWNRIMWAGILMIFSLGLILTGGLETIQTAALLTGLPLVFIAVIMIFSCVKSIKNILKK